MKISCEKCGQTYEVDASRIPAAGLTMKCTRCLHSFAVRPASDAPEQVGTELDLSDGADDAGPLVPPAPDLGPRPALVTPPPPSGATKYYIRRPTGKVFGPFPKPSIDEMLLQHKLSGNEEISTDGEHWKSIATLGQDAPSVADDIDLPAPKGAHAAGEDLADLPGLPASKAGGLELPDLPAPKGAGVPGIVRGPASMHELPRAPATRGGTLMGFGQQAGSAGGPLDLADFDPSAGTPQADLPDLPAPRGAARPPAITDLPAPKGPLTPPPPGLADLPAPKGALTPPPPGLADLPAPKGALTPPPPGLADLPAPKGPPAAGFADLPAPKSPLGDRPSAAFPDLPAPKSPVGDLPAPKPPGAPLGGAIPAMAPTLRAAPPPAAGDLPDNMSFASPTSRATGMDYGEIDLGSEEEVEDAALGDLPLPPPQAAPTAAGASPFDLPLPGAPGAAPGASPFDLPPPGAGTPGASPFDLPPPAASAAGASPFDLPLPGQAPPAAEESPFTFNLSDVGAAPDDDDDAAVISSKLGSETLDPLTFGKVTEEEAEDGPGTAPVVLDDSPLTLPAAAVAAAPEKPRGTGVVAPPAAPPQQKRGLKLDLKLPESRGARIGLGVGALVIVAGIGLGFTDMGFFGTNLLFGGDGGPGRPAVGDGGALLAKGRAELLPDTFKGYGAAAEAFGNAVAARAEDADAKALQAQALSALVVRFSQRQHVAVIQQLIAALAPQQEPSAEVEKARGVALLAEGKAAEALPLLQKVSDRTPADVMAAVYLGWAQLAGNQPQAAQGAFRRALAAKKDAVAAILGMAQAELRANNAPHAAVQVQAGLAAAPGHPGLLLLQGDLALQDKKPDAARAAWEKITARTPPAVAPTEIVAAQGKLGAMALQAGENDRAKQAFEAAIKVDPADGPANVGLGRLCFAAGQYKQALAHFERAPADPIAAILIARTQLVMGNALHARNALEALVKQQPQNAEVRFLMGLSGELANDMEGAIKNYNEAIKLKADYFDPYLQLSRVYLAQKKTADAFAALQQASTALPRSAAVRNALGEAHLAVGELDKAVIFFEEALAIDAKLNDAAFNLGRAQWDKSRLKGLPPEEARTLADKGIARLKELEQRDPRYRGLAAQLGEIQAQQQNFAEAAKAYDRALEVDNPSPELRLAAARIYNRAADYKKAVEQTEIVSQLHPTLADARAVRAEARLGQGHHGEALVEIQQALQREQKPFYYEVQGRTYEAMKRFAEAIEAYGEAIKLAPERTDLQLWRGKLLVKRGAVKDGMKEMQQVIKRNPDMAEPYLYIGIALFDLGKEGEAARSLEQAISKDPTLAEAHLRLGQMANDKQSWSKALFHLQLAVKHGAPTANWRAEALYLLGTIARKQGQKERAISALQEFLQIAPAEDGMRPDALKALKELGAEPKPKPAPAVAP